MLEQLLVKAQLAAHPWQIVITTGTEVGLDCLMVLTGLLAAYSLIPSLQKVPLRFQFTLLCLPTAFKGTNFQLQCIRTVLSFISPCCLIGLR